MKKTKTIFVALILSASMILPQEVKAQAPEKMSYQTIVRNASNNLVVSTAVGMQISILQTTANGTAVYVETQTPSTNANGLVSLEIGNGTPVAGTFASINWANGPYFVKTEIDPLGGTTYTITGTSQLLSVPYALHAKTAGTSYTQVQRDALTAYVGLVVYNTTTNKPNFYNGTEWMNYDGTSAKTLAIGVAHQGGIIAYILQPGDPGYDANVTHGIIAAPSDQSTGAEWGCYGTGISGADGTAIGTGNQNTIDIMAGCATAGIAARICGDLSLDGYDDWYLPSIDELNKLYINRVAIGGFANIEYWSSTEYGNGFAWLQFFSNGNQYYIDKDYYISYVRSVRAF